jgi:uroporphyrinogen-III decarboxylase
VDGVIFFSDILTPLPALGIEFDVIGGKGPVIPRPIATAQDVEALRPLVDPHTSLPFIERTLSTLRREVEGRATLLGEHAWTHTRAHTQRHAHTQTCTHTAHALYSRTRNQLLTKIDTHTHTHTGFVGAPFTLAAYSIEGGSSKECKKVKHMMMYDPALLSRWDWPVHTRTLTHTHMHARAHPGTYTDAHHCTHTRTRQVPG